MTPDPTHADGVQTMAALMGVRDLLREVQGLLAEASRQLGERGWVRGTRSQKASHLSNRWDAPEHWMPTYVMRWFLNPERPGVRLGLVVHLASIDGQPDVPAVAFAAFVGTQAPPTGPGAAPLSDVDAAGHGADLLVGGEAAPPGAGLQRRPWDEGERLGVLVPLLGLDGPAALQERVLRPVLDALPPA
jgi:hypothetical protein